MDCLMTRKHEHDNTEQPATILLQPRRRAHPQGQHLPKVKFLPSDLNGMGATKLKLRNMPEYG
jgi:hypothetical protein